MLIDTVIRAVAKTAISEHGWEELGIEDGCEGLIQPSRVRELNIADVRGILPQGGTIPGTTKRANPFHHEADVDGEVIAFDVSEEVIYRVQVLGPDASITIGGDGLLRIAHELMTRGLKGSACPKRSAMTRKERWLPSASTPPSTRPTGHLRAAYHSREPFWDHYSRGYGLGCRPDCPKGRHGSGANVILIPKIPHNVQVVTDKIDVRNQCGTKFSILVAAEGAKPVAGEAGYQAERKWVRHDRWGDRRSSG